MLLRIPRVILRPSRKALVIGSSIACFVWGAISISLISDHPSLSDHIELKVRFDGNSYNEQPILSGGLKGASDLIYVQYINNDTAKFGYRSTGGSNILSKPVHLIRNQEHSLGIWSPTLIIYNGSLYEPDTKVKVIVDGASVIDQEGTFHIHDPEEISLGRNQDYDNVNNSILEGVISRIDRKSIEWYLREPESRKTGLENFFIALPRRLFIPLFLCGLLIILLWPFYENKDNAIHLLFSWLSKNKIWEKNKWPLITISFCAFLYFLFITNGSLVLFENEFFSNFYDYQGVSILHGHLDVPSYAIQFEAFLYKGKSYGYFGIVPGLFRIPFILLGIGFGKLTRIFMLTEYIGILVFAYLIALKVSNKAMHLTNNFRSNYYIIIWLLNFGLGSTLIFTAHRAFVYHEAMTSAILLSLMSCYFVIDYLYKEDSLNWVYAILLSILCINARPTMGVFTLCFISTASVLNILKFSSILNRKAMRHFIVIGFCGLSFLSTELINYLKFDSFETQPYQYYVLNNAQRNARTEGKHFFIDNIPWNANGYLWGANYIFDREFPFFYAKWPNPAIYPNAKIDHIEPIVSLLYTWLGIGTLVIITIYLYNKLNINQKYLFIISFISLLIVLSFFLCAPFQSERYKTEFITGSVVLSSLSLIYLINNKLKYISALLFILTIYSIYINISLTIQYRREPVWTMPHQVRSEWKDIIDHGY